MNYQVSWLGGWVISLMTSWVLAFGFFTTLSALATKPGQLWADLVAPPNGLGDVWSRFAYVALSTLAVVFSLTCLYIAGADVAARVRRQQPLVSAPMWVAGVTVSLLAATFAFT